MKRQYRSATGAVLLFLLIGLLSSGAHAEGQVHLMTGEISAIDMDYDTVVIEVPLGSQIFTVGGSLDSNVNLKKNGRLVSLHDFKVGESVKVRWRSTTKGHIIEALSVR